MIFKSFDYLYYMYRQNKLYVIRMVQSLVALALVL